MTSTIQYPKRARIVEVGPRDGLQNEKQPIDIATRIQLINQLAEAGLSHIEAGSFVNPSWVPQMAGSEDVFAQISRAPGVHYLALTPNMRGFDRAVVAKVSEVAVFAAASEAFSQKNINCSIAESIARFEPVMQAAKERGIPVRGYVSTVAGCPYQGDVSVDAVVNLSVQLLEMGCYEVSMGDTIGAGIPEQIRQLLSALLLRIPAEKLAVHFHDTNGRALENIKVALELGISVIDSSIAGLGGCPYAEGASGNVATEDVVNMLDELGIEHGLNLNKLISTGQYISDILGRVNGSKVALTTLSK
jgi:hydroxymethylglutaryl-CoA lyase